MKKPATLIPAWPPSGAAEARWANEGNFWTHARSVGRENPWDLIIFNFQTQDPREVNWYLQQAVGCWRLDPAGNFKFDSSLTSDGEDGIIYVPPQSWTPPAHFSRGSGAGTFMAGIQNAAATILRDLSVRMPTVRYGATIMRPQDYKTVADLVENKEISIDIDPDRGSPAGYSPDDKAIRLKFFPRIGNARHAASLANEAVHAATHYHEIPHNMLRNEYVSTVAGAIAMGLTSERVLLRYINPARFKNWGYYYSGWVWNHFFKPRGIWSIDLEDLDVQFEHPFLSTTANPLSELKTAMTAYGWKGPHDSFPQWD
ncbi:MAG: hypothetical protein Tsb0019_06310 [Roseibium sp.]